MHKRNTVRDWRTLAEKQFVSLIALRGQAKNSTDLRDICVRSDKLSQTSLKVLLKTPLGNIFSAVWQNFSKLFTQEVNISYH